MKFQDILNLAVKNGFKWNGKILEFIAYTKYIHILFKNKDSNFQLKLSYEEIIFNHDFLKSIYGEEVLISSFGYKIFEHHGVQLFLLKSQKQRIKYLEDTVHEKKI